MTDQIDYEAKALAELAGADYFRAELAAALNADPEDDRDLVLIAAYKAGVTYALSTAQVYATLATIGDRRAELIEIELAELKRRRGNTRLAFEDARTLPTSGGGILPAPADGRY